METNVHALPQNIDPKQRELFETLYNALIPFCEECTFIEILGAIRYLEMEALAAYSLAE